MKCSKLRRLLGLRPRPRWGSLRRSPIPPSRYGLLAFGNRSFAPSALAISPPHSDILVGPPQLLDRGCAPAYSGRVFQEEDPRHEARDMSRLKLMDGSAAPAWLHEQLSATIADLLDLTYNYVGYVRACRQSLNSALVHLLYVA